MGRKSNFWRNFWGETGRNSGKWASNKVFGPAGWATPRRHIIDSDNSTPSFKRPKSSSENTSSSESKVDWSEARVDRIIEMANGISFNSSNTEEICAKLDDLLTGAQTANRLIHSNNLCNKVFVSKIKAGIMRLRRNEEHELADFYFHELKSVTRSANWSKTAPWIFIFIGVLFIIVMNFVLGNFD